MVVDKEVEWNGGWRDGRKDWRGGRKDLHAKAKEEIPLLGL